MFYLQKTIHFNVIYVYRSKYLLTAIYNSIKSTFNNLQQLVFLQKIT